MLRKFLRSESGNVALASAVVLPTLLASIGLSVDISHLLNMKTHLQNAADVAVLVASREGTSPSQRNALFLDYLRANMASEGVSISAADIVVEEGINFLRVTGRATANVDLYFMQHLGVKQVSVEAVAFRSAHSMEIALVLDNTGSMGEAGIAALRRASHALVDAVEQGRAPNQDVRIALVPFVTAVNIRGEGYNPAWVDQTGQSLYNGWNFIDDAMRQRRLNGERLSTLPEGFGSNSTGSGTGGGQACTNLGQGEPAIIKRERCRKSDLYPHHLRLFEHSGTTWRGCVEARPYPYNFTLEAPDPSRPDTLFVPYFAADEPGNRRTDNGGNDANNYNNSWLDDEVSGTEAERQRSTLKYVDPTPSVMRVHEVAPLTLGPNRACPTPIVPLTATLSKVRTAIDAMRHWNGSGTNIAEGLAWGWRVLSPQAPYTEAGAFDPTERQKYMILMTDGRNVSYGARNTMNRSDYGAYNFLGTGRINNTTDQGVAETTLNGWTLDMCREMKAQGIEIYTVIYNETAPSVHNLFRSCATRPENFYMTSNTSALQTAFANIGRQLSKLRLTQ